MDIKLNRLANVIAGCWTEAESSLTQLIAQKHPSPPEELITNLLAGELRSLVDLASEDHRIERAFLEDLESEIPDLSYSDAQRFGGLVASVTPHNKSHEGNISAADLGLVVLRPQVQLDGWRDNAIVCTRDQATGLLAQAKLGHHKKRRKGYSWGKLQKQQQELYPSRQSYYALLLYRLKGERLNEFGPVGWQLCQENTLEQVKEWLRLDAFPKENTTPELLKMLFDRSIGTEDPTIIQSVIAPNHEDARVVEIRIFWPDGSGPPSQFDLERHRNQQTHVQYVRQ